MGSEELRAKLRAAAEAFSGARARWLLGRSRHIVEAGGLKPEEAREVLMGMLKDELERGWIMSELKERGPLTVPELSETTGLPKREVLRHLICLMGEGKVVAKGRKGDYHAFSAT